MGVWPPRDKRAAELALLQAAISRQAAGDMAQARGRGVGVNPALKHQAPEGRVAWLRETLDKWLDDKAGNAGGSGDGLDWPDA